ncbi:TetR/AcrR family transcriptional regulator [Pseudoalteromonas agarivorans]|uniref:TetR/AcrR family transcriptional regulator n=1 Tax=Pseudoalteromonas agarivorans TaxID=176102 RepID=UPI0003D66EE5|nr:TetR/AcrR family transcriptional regulator [Pseudoalteromonas agarivorans]ETJ49736.1 TetR family transcriptional regulator [Pseudoalteromonas agarivorans]
MSEHPFLAPKQQRSQQTQEKLVKALHHSLKSKFFEHISIKELADYSEVSVGTFYRRFKNKESLLPMLYQDFGIALDNWVSELEAQHYKNLDDVVNTLCHKTYVFLSSQQGVFRTLHLNSRLHSELLGSDKHINRRVIYQRLAQLISQTDTKVSETAAGTAVFLIVSSLLDKVLYHDLTPAIACDLSAQQYAQELPKIILAYLG